MPFLSARLEPGAMVDSYRLERKLGEGALGQVWAAVDEGEQGRGRRVALKLLRARLEPGAVEALRREARLGELLDHPCIVPVLGVGRHRDVVYVVMDHVEGRTLGQVQDDLRGRGMAWPLGAVLEVGHAVAEALHHAWTAPGPDGLPLRVVHRDLSPDNVLMSDTGRVLVGDFSLSQVGHDLSGPASRPGGTPCYMAPEAWLAGPRLTPASDLFSLGVILWELATGGRFFDGVAETDIIDVLVDRDPAREAQHVEAAFPGLAGLLGRMLRRRPHERPQEARQVAAELGALLDREGGAGDLAMLLRQLRSGRPPADGKAAGETSASLRGGPGTPQSSLDPERTGR